jgi:hypothetical protein
MRSAQKPVAVHMINNLAESQQHLKPMIVLKTGSSPNWLGQNGRGFPISFGEDRKKLKLP